MKKTLIIALGALAFAACKNGAGSSSTAGSTESAGAVVETVYDIAYIQMDSLLNGYNRAIDLSAAFESKATKTQNDLEARARSIQNEVNSFTEKVNKGLMTSRDAQAEQIRIENKGRQFDNDSQLRQAELAEEQQVMMNQIFHAINDYVARFNAGYQYKMILTTSGGTPLLHADPALDITQRVLRGLNDEYAAEKK